MKNKWVIVHSNLVIRYAPFCHPLSPFCHPERSEGSFLASDGLRIRKILRYAQNDIINSLGCAQDDREENDIIYSLGYNKNTC